MMQRDHQPDHAPKQPKSVYQAITVYVIALVVVVTIAVNALTFFYSVHEEENLYQGKLSTYAAYLSESLELPLWNIDNELVGKIGASFASNAEIATLIIRDDRQQVVYQSLEPAESQFKREIEIRHNGAKIGSVEIGLTSAELEKKDRQLLIGSIASALLLIVLLLLVMRLILARLFEAPVSMLIGVINDVVIGKYQQQFPVASHVEFEPILSSFKTMSDTVASRELSLREANEQLAAEVEERRRAQTELQASESKLAAILDGVEAYIYIKDVNYRYQFANRRVCELFARPLTEIIGHEDGELFGAETAANLRLNDKRVIELGERVSEEEINTTIDGKVTRAFWSVKLPLYDSTGNIYALCGISTDITEIKKIEQRLRFSERMLRQTQAVAKIGSWRLDVSSNELVWSDETYRMFDVPLGVPLTQQDFFERVYPDDRDRVDAAWQAALKGKPYLVEHRIATRGQIRWVEERAELECDAQGNLVTGIGSVQDITERKQAELERQESAAKFRTTIEAMPVPLAIHDAQDNITYLNQAFTRTLGYTLDDIPSLSSWWPLAYPDVQYRQGIRDSWQRSVEQAQLNKTTVPPMEEKVRCKDGSTRTMLISVTDLEENLSGERLIVMYDVTELKEYAASLFKLSQAVEQSPSSIVITDLEARIEYANTAYTTITGYTLDEVIGKNPRILQSGKTPKATYEDMWAKLTRGETWQGELINRRKDGSEYIESAQISPVRQADGKITHYLGIKENITEKKKTAARIESLAHFDQLTGLPNRVLLNDRSRYAMSLAQRNEEQLVVMFIDLDHFKDINDTLGHSIGDLLLMEVSRRIRSVLREEDTVARLGGDEFILILPATDEDGATHVASKLVEAIAMPCQIEGHELVSTPSIGIAIYPYDGEDFETLSKNADAAMYQAKQSGRNCFRFYTPEMQAHSSRNLQLANALRFALARDEFRLHYQPQLSIRDGHVIGAEALLRWQHPEFGMVSPAEFIPVAEDSGMIIPIGEWVLRSAASQLREWLDRGFPPMMMAVNLSAVQFRQADLVDTVTRIMSEEKLPCEYLEIELTEAAAMGDPKGAVAIMDRLHEQGIRMSIDDFGTGYSSLSYLKKFKVYKLKIDQSFVCDLTDDTDDKAIVTTIINMASSLGIRTIAEGVETAGQLAFLRMQGCDEVQGYYFSKPLPAEQFELFMKNTGMGKDETPDQES
ncbi:MAG: EAL domain-containing protein [Nitrosomonadales bacterium]|nr:EAL domain-containing protein [Nitrosomonadales bacterium]